MSWGEKNQGEKRAKGKIVILLKQEKERGWVKDRGKSIETTGQQGGLLKKDQKASSPEQGKKAEGMGHKRKKRGGGNLGVT